MRKRIAVLDVGSSAFHVAVAELAGCSAFEVVASAKETVRLGERSLVEGRIPDEVCARAAEALQRLRRFAGEHGARELIACGTSAVREARNRESFLAAMREASGVAVRAISPEEEARLVYLGVRQALELRRGLACIADLGGGSLELMLAGASGVSEVRSLGLGVLRLRGPLAEGGAGRLFERCREALSGFAEVAQRRGLDRLILTGGTARALSALAQRHAGEAEPRFPARLGRLAISGLERELAGKSEEERGRVEGLDPKRADTIVPGAVILGALYDSLGLGEATVCRSSLREGMITDYLSRSARVSALPEVP